MSQQITPEDIRYLQSQELSDPRNVNAQDTSGHSNRNQAAATAQPSSSQRSGFISHFDGLHEYKDYIFSKF